MELRGLVHAHDHGTDAVQAPIACRSIRLERQQRALPVLPATDILCLGRVEIALQRRSGVEPGLSRGAPEGERHHEMIRGGPIDLRAERHVAVLRPRRRAGQLAVGMQVAPTVRAADEADGALEPRHRARERERASIPLGEQHRHALVLVHPPGIARAAVAEMRREQHEQAQCVLRVGERCEPYPLQEGRPIRIAADVLLDPIAAPSTAVQQAKGWDAVFGAANAVRRVSLLLGEEPAGIGDDEAEVADASLIDPRIENFVDDAVTQREPEAALMAERRSDATLGARCPARGDAGPARRAYALRAHVPPSCAQTRYASVERAGQGRQGKVTTRGAPQRMSFEFSSR